MTALTAEPTNPATRMFSILAADKLAQEGLDFIASQDDATLVNKPGLSEDELAQIVGEHDGMIVRSGVQVTAKVLENPGRLKVIARAGVGVDNIDLDAATAKGILVMNTAAANTISTAEHAFALMIGLARNLGPAYRAMAEGRWDRSTFTGRQLCGKTLGVVGFGRIGQCVAERALAFDMNVVAYDPFINADTMFDGRVKMYPEFEDILPHADILTFHVPMNDQTRGMLNARTFAKCRKGVMVVNAARGGVIDEDDLLEAIESGQCGGAGIDVYPTEPPPEDSKLRNHPRVLTTPHLGASTVEAQQAVSVSAAEQVFQYLRGEGITGAVNAGNLRVDLSPIQASYNDLAHRMAQLISPMITRGIECVTIDVRGDELASAAGTIERTALVSLLNDHLSDPVNIINVKNVADSRGIRSRTAIDDDDKAGTQLIIEVQGPPDAVDDQTQPGDRTRRIVGRIYDDLRPRVIEINGYSMDMIPAGHMVLIQNDDRPGMIGAAGNTFGEAQVNIADMAISRRRETALMLLKIDAEAPGDLFDKLRAVAGIRKVCAVKLADETV